MLDELTQFLIGIGIMPERHGFIYLKMVLDVINDSSMTLKSAYGEISKAKGVSVCTIDSSIRNVINSAYNSNKLRTLNEKIGIDIIGDRCPTNKELIAILSQYFKDEIGSGIGGKLHVKEVS